MKNIGLCVHEEFEKFVLKNRYDFSLVRNPDKKDTNNYVEEDTAQIFDVFFNGYYSAVKQVVTAKTKGK